MTVYTLVLWLSREISAEEREALREAGLDDAGIEPGPLGALADFTRDAASPEEAVASAVRDIRKVPGLRVLGGSVSGSHG